MTATTSTILDTHQDEDTNGGEWPYPTKYTTYLIEGDLADRVRARVGITHGRVTFHETNESGGYSEWTQENYYNVRIEVDGSEVYDSSTGWWDVDDVIYDPSRLARLNLWLNEVPE